MDPRFLEEDEFHLELEIRGIDKCNDQAVEILRSTIEEEASGLKQAPSSLHLSFRTIHSECSVVQWKLSTILVQSGDIRELAKCRSRYLHLLGRVTRLTLHSGSHAQVARLKSEIEEGLLKCTNWIESQLNTNTAVNVQETMEQAAQVHARSLVQTVRSERNLNYPSASVQHSPKDLDRIEQAFQEQDKTIIQVVQDRIETNVTEAQLQHSPTGQLVPLLNLTIDAGQSSPVNNRPEQHLFPEAVVNNNGQNCELSPDTGYRYGVRHNNPSADQNEYAVATPNLIPHGTLGATLSNAHQANFATQNMSTPGPHHERASDRGFQSNISQGWRMSKWSLRFAGSSQDLAVDEFLFRVETLARLENLPLTALTLGLHQLLTGAAAAWYWIYIRREPKATWAQFKEALTFAFQSNISDAAIRRLIMDRLQRPGERFMEFCIEVQGLEVRLLRRMKEVELLDTLRRNMLPLLQDRLLFVVINSILELQQRVRQIEDLTQRQLEVHHIRRPSGKIHELSYPPPAVVADDVDWSRQPPGNYFVEPSTNSDVLRNIHMTPLSQLPPGYSTVGTFPQAAGQLDCVNAISTVDRNSLSICWNCDDIGHTYMDCTRTRRIFCYGCGTKDVVRPQCPKCSVRILSGNAQRNARQSVPTGIQRALGHQAFRPPQ